MNNRKIYKTKKWFLEKINKNGKIFNKSYKENKIYQYQE